jgi:hypothetical protein
VLTHPVIGSRFAEEVFAGGFDDQAELFEFEVGALDFAFVDGEFLGQRGGRRKGFAGGEGFVADLVVDLFANLRVDRIVRQVFQFNVHVVLSHKEAQETQKSSTANLLNRHFVFSVLSCGISQSVLVTFDRERGESGFKPFASANRAANS